MERTYKDFNKVFLGLSDIAALVMVGCKADKLESEVLNFGSDGSYNAYLVYGKDVEIGSHYKEVARFEHWLKVYDDIELSFDVKGKEIRVYRSGNFGCIIQVIE